MSWIHDLASFAKRLLTLEIRVKSNAEEIEAFSQDLKKLTELTQKIAYSLKYNRGKIELEREQLILKLQNELLKLEKQLSQFKLEQQLCLFQLEQKLNQCPCPPVTNGYNPEQNLLPGNETNSDESADESTDGSIDESTNGI